MLLADNFKDNEPVWEGRIGESARYMKIRLRPGHETRKHSTRSDNQLMIDLKKGYQDHAHLIPPKSGKRRQGKASAGWIWGHLLNHDLGGGPEPENQTILTDGSNGANANGNHRGLEVILKNVIDSLSNHEKTLYPDNVYELAVDYQVEVLRNGGEYRDDELYNLSPEIPFGLRINCHPFLRLKPGKNGYPQFIYSANAQEWEDKLVELHNNRQFKISNDKLKDFSKLFKTNLIIANTQRRVDAGNTTNLVSQSFQPKTLNQTTSTKRSQAQEKKRKEREEKNRAMEDKISQGIRVEPPRKKSK